MQIKNESKKTKFVLDMVENNVEKQENAGYPHFLFLRFSKAAFLRIELTHSHTVTPFDALGKQAF